MVDVSGVVDAEAGSRLRMYSVADLRPHPRNVKKHPERQLRLLADEIKRDGFNAPIAVWRDTFVIAGEGRLEAAKLAGLTEIPGIDCNHLDEAGARRFMLADNRLGELAEYDADALRAELNSLSEFDDMDLDAIGFGLDDLDAILPPLEPEPAPPAPPAPKREASPKAPSPKPPADKTEPTDPASTEPETPPAQSGVAAAAEVTAPTETQPEPAKPAVSAQICSPGETWRIGEGLELTLEAFASPAELYAADMMIRKGLEIFDLKSRRKSDGASVSKVLEDRNTHQPHAAGEGASAEN
ncbi:ParB-like nuclease [Oceanicaulis sp. HTCC2633]|uniref:ParB/Srx family N-terminal domain-containing protein n=1 Tax=Oceanicaulis sp. HTCC2633 TaxID=314254 RepID=UPI00006699CC|nr:ParB/Srx family N-terminal domain-containing protein [Oceanicaulis sp. HTCC2633]EAP89158.1 ParB-like nuclease [Oceanicaulis sp. HTCC2633]